MFCRSLFVCLSCCVFVIVFSVLLQLTASDYPYDIFDLRLLITPMVSSDLRLLITPMVSSTYGFWLPLWYLWLTASDYPYGIFDLRLLITPMVSSTYGFWLPLWYLQTVLQTLFYHHIYRIYEVTLMTRIRTNHLVNFKHLSMQDSIFASILFCVQLTYYCTSNVYVVISFFFVHSVLIELVWICVGSFIDSIYLIAVGALIIKRGWVRSHHRMCMPVPS
jgi:hypothetical protein